MSPTLPRSSKGDMIGCDQPAASLGTRYRPQVGRASLARERQLVRQSIGRSLLQQVGLRPAIASRQGSAAVSTPRRCRDAAGRCPSSRGARPRSAGSAPRSMSRKNAAARPRLAQRSPAAPFSRRQPSVEMLRAAVREERARRMRDQQVPAVVQDVADVADDVRSRPLGRAAVAGASASCPPARPVVRTPPCDLQRGQSSASRSARPPASVRAAPSPRRLPVELVGTGVKVQAALSGGWRRTEFA